MNANTLLELIAHFVCQVRKDLNGKQLQGVKDTALPICWKGSRPFKSVQDVRNYFNTFALSFTGAINIQLQLPPEAYLIVTVSTSETFCKKSKQSAVIGSKIIYRSN